MTLLPDALKAALLLFLAVIVQATIVGSFHVLRGTPDLVLVLLLVIALLRGSIFGAVAGFWAGFLLDTAYLGTLGVSSLLLTLAGYWIGRYGETTGRDRAHAPFVSVAVVTFLFAVGELVLQFLLGEAVEARAALIDAMPATLALNLLLTVPVYAVVRRLLAPERDTGARSLEVPIVG
ncbi:MAG TPA: rod shape-determining protein MreD [Gaiellaceae bacterium]|nr:rod shape-determining protein MreD [Gaiellaceae bacterium]